MAHKAWTSYTEWTVEETPVKKATPSVPFTEFTTQEDLLAFLMADPPTKASNETETDTTADKDEHGSMLRNKDIAALKQQLADLSIAADDKLFKSSTLNVGKYVLGPIPDDSAMVACHANHASEEQSNAAADGIDTSGKLLEVDDLAIPTLIESGLHEDHGKDFNGDVDAKVNENVDEHVDETVDVGTQEGPKEAETGNVIEDGNAPRVPPNTPDVGERIWWRNEFVVIKKSTLGGLGAFAAKDLVYGDKILEEMPLVRTNNWNVCNEYDNMCDEDKELFQTLHKFSSNPAAHDIEKIRRANSFQLPKGVAIYSVTSRFNHACLPVRNVNYVINGKGDAKIKLTAIKAIPKGTELTICYGGQPEQLLRGFGFRCQCGGCTPLTDREAEDIMSAWRGDANWANKW
ncbi:SET domain-containing protein [Coniochaeta ligniaria NRRL 30616]|uniref:SET domain-containing protein n=1 Tax=Coniochaeta ligniaria NRRL 30616 TaxID=1408157 RepID=A0A1J7IYC6_9PEZI|nr:SET domain-containing protein [Coniochaeta ligniaria NRRL 30616]